MDKKLKPIPAGNKGLPKLPKTVRKMEMLNEKWINTSTRR